MKKVVFVMIAVSFLGFQASAQSINFGLKAGMTASNMKAKSSGITMSFDTKIGFYAGVVAEIGVADNFAIQPELEYSLMGAKMNMDFGEGSISSTLDLSYVSLPVLVKYKKQGFSAFVGPQIGYLISAKQKADGDSEDIKDEFNSTDFSGVIGVGYTLSNGFGFDARYQQGFSNIAKESEGEGTLKNNAFKVGVHYFFNK